MVSFNKTSSSEDSVVEIPAPPPRPIEVVTIRDDSDGILFGDVTMAELAKIVNEVPAESFDWDRIVEEVPPSRMGTPPNNASSDLTNLNAADPPLNANSDLTNLNAAASQEVDVVQIDTPFIVVQKGEQLYIVPVEIVNKTSTPPPSPIRENNSTATPILRDSLIDETTEYPSPTSHPFYSSISAPPHDSEYDVSTECAPNSPHPSFSPISVPSVCNYNTRHAGHTPAHDTPMSLDVCECPFCDGLALPIIPPPSPRKPTLSASTPTPPDHPMYSPDDIVFTPSRTSTPNPEPVAPAITPATPPRVPRPSNRLQNIIRRLNFADEHQAGPSQRQARHSPQPEPLPESPQPEPLPESPQPEPARQIPDSPVSRISRRVYVDREMPRALNQLNLLVEWQNQFLVGLGRRIRSAERQEMLRRFAELDIVAFRLNLYFRDLIDRLEGNPTDTSNSDNEQ